MWSKIKSGLKKAGKWIVGNPDQFIAAAKVALRLKDKK